MKPLLSAALIASLAPAAFAGASKLPLPEGVGRAPYLSECGGCHLAYPPQLLSAQSWSRLMAGLSRHFGSDASVDAATAATIGAYLQANAGSPRKFGAAVDRISATRWFAHEHDEVPAAVWASPAVGSAANCGACHAGAERGDYSERTVRLPRTAPGDVPPPTGR
jgi:hypothetical protein